MLVGIGMDLVEVDRFRSVLARTPGVRDRVFRPEERAYADAKRDPVERYAVRFAAKEAVMKALGCGLGEIAMLDIEVVRAESGAPSVRLHGKAAQVAADKGIDRWMLTLTHTERTAQALVVALGRD